MIVALHDADDTNYPNLALMKLSAWHKGQGDDVIWFAPDTNTRYDRVYSSKVFTWTPEYSRLPTETIKCGIGYGVFDTLPDAVEHTCPDYAMYRHVHERRNRRRKKPEPEYSLGFTTRGCPNTCPWCIVHRKEGNIPRQRERQQKRSARTVGIVRSPSLAQGAIPIPQKRFKHVVQDGLLPGG